MTTTTTTTPFVVGDRVMNTGNKRRNIIGIVTRVIDDEFCEVLWSDGDLPHAWTGTIKRDGLPDYDPLFLAAHNRDRIVRVKLSVRVPGEAREN